MVRQTTGIYLIEIYVMFKYLKYDLTNVKENRS